MDHSLCHTGLKPVLNSDTFAKAVAPNPIRGERFVVDSTTDKKLISANESKAALSALAELINILNIYGVKCEPFRNSGLIKHHKEKLPSASITITRTLDPRHGRASDLYCSCCCIMTKDTLFLVPVCEIKFQRISDTSRVDVNVSSPFLGGLEDDTSKGDVIDNPSSLECQYELILLRLFPHSCPENNVLRIPKNLNDMGTGWIKSPFPIDAIFGTCYKHFTDKLDVTSQSGIHHGEI